MPPTFTETGLLIARGHPGSAAFLCKMKIFVKIPGSARFTLPCGIQLWILLLGSVELNSHVSWLQGFITDNLQDQDDKNPSLCERQLVNHCQFILRSHTYHGFDAIK